MSKVFFSSAIIISLVFSFRAQANQDINMNEGRELAKLSVDETLISSPFDTYAIEDYWSYVHSRMNP